MSNSESRPVYAAFIVSVRVSPTNRFISLHRYIIMQHNSCIPDDVMTRLEKIMMKNLRCYFIQWHWNKREKDMPLWKGQTSKLLSRLKRKRKPTAAGPNRERSRKGTKNPLWVTLEFVSSKLSEKTCKAQRALLHFCRVKHWGKKAAVIPTKRFLSEQVLYRTVL